MIDRDLIDRLKQASERGEAVDMTGWTRARKRAFFNGVPETFREYDRVALSEPIEGYPAGTVGTIVDINPKSVVIEVDIGDDLISVLAAQIHSLS